MEKLESCLDYVQRYDSEGLVKYSKRVLDIEKLRSDSRGLFWAVGSDGKQSYLIVAGSPASCANHFKNNVFGLGDIGLCARILLRAASSAIGCVLPDYREFQCRRVDITANYILPDKESVSLALRQLAVSDAARRISSSPKNGGDSVYWSASSTFSKGKVYQKGAHMRYLIKKQVASLPCDDDIYLLDRVLRFEHTRGSAFFRRLEENGQVWHEVLTEEYLQKLFLDFFSPLVAGVGVEDMNREEFIKCLIEENGITENQACAVFTTWRNIQQDGFFAVKGYMSKPTFYRHLRYMRAIGITDADMTTAKVLPIRRVKIILAEPISSWQELRAAA